ncbi:MAG TPA: hypothetical protein VGG99_04245 [Acetobacteraceae bacterium]
MTEAGRAEFADAVQDAGAALPPDCQQGFARLAKLVRARPHKFQLLILDCRDETLRDRLSEDLDELLQVSGGRTTRLRLSAKDHPDFAAVERALTRLAETNAAIHVTGGSAWFDTPRWEAFNIRRDAIAHEVRTSLLLWLDEDSIADLARVAIDLWAWRTSVITFATAPQRLTMREPDIRAIDDRTRDERAARIEFLHRTLLEPDIPEDIRVGFALEMGDLAASLGRVAEAESAYREAVAAATDEHSRAVTMGRIADILQVRGALDEALRIRREEELPVYERLGDVRSRALTMGRIADILQARGALDEALRIHREELLPVFERLGDVRSRAVTMGKIADILQARGALDEALRIRREEELPVYERLGDVRERAVTMGKIADILQARGALNEALRIRREEELPVYERLGDVRARAVTMGKIADILEARGALDEALRIRREEELPVFERLGDVRERAVTLHKVAEALIAAGGLDDARAPEIHAAATEALAIARRLKFADGVAYTGTLLAQILVRAGRIDEALPILDEAEAGFATLGDAAGLEQVKQIRGTLSESAG